jgi:hypothetical protein
MTTELSPQLRQSLDRLIGYDAIDAQPDWGDVAGRAARGRRRSLVLAILACFALAVFVSAAFAFGNDLWQLVAGKPVSTKRLSPEERRMFASLASGRPILRTQPNDPALRRLGKDVSVRLLADQGGYTFYVIEVRGRYPTRCFATGRAWKPRLFGSMVCPIPGRRPEPGSFPSAEHPVLDQSAFDPRSGQPRVFRLVGFAAVPVKKVGLLTADGDVIATVPVVNSTYLKTTGLPAKGVEAIVAFDGSGRRVYCEDIAADDPCGNRQALGHVKAPPPSPPQPEPPQVRRGALVQRGESQGVSVSIYKPGIAVFDITSVSARVRRLATGASAGCLRVRFLNGRWLSDDLDVSVRAGAVGRAGDRLRIDLAGGRPYSLPYAVPPPYDGCELNGVFGRRWNDAFGTRAPVEIPLSEAGRHFFNDRAAARDLAYFVRSKRVQQIRLNSSPRPGLEALARRYPHRVVGLLREDQFAPEDKIGFWIGPGTIRFTTTSSTGRRFFVNAVRRTLKLPRSNLGDLAFVF